MKTNKRIVEIKKLLTPTDFFAAAVIIIGLLIAIFISEIAVRLIGVSIIILGVVALFMMLSQRLSEIVETRESRFSPSQPQNLKITIKKDTSAKRIVFEDFQKSFDSQEEPQQPAPENFAAEIKGDEGFRFIQKFKGSEAAKQTNDKTGDENKTANKSELKENIEVSPIIKPIEKANETHIFADTIDSELISNDNIESIPEQDKIEAAPEPIPSEPIIIINKPSESETDLIEGSLFQENDEDDYIEPEPEFVPETEMISVTPQAPDEIESEEQVTQDQPSSIKYKEKSVKVSISDLMEEIPALSNEPRKELEYFLNRVLMVVRSVINARTAAFMFVNHDRRECTLESFISDEKNAISDTSVFPFGNDVISQIVLNSQPEILTEINPTAELDLIPYYKNSVGTQSFIGVPVFYNNQVIGIFCADTNVADAYDSITVGFLGNFTKLISALLQSYTEKYDLLQASRTLDAINLFRSISSESETSSEEIIDSAVRAASRLLEYSTVGICGYDAKYGWVVKAVVSVENANGHLAGSPVLLDSSLVGKSILTGETIVSSPIEDNLVRLHPRESANTGGFFLSVPLKSASTSYGALFAEGANPGSLTNFDIKILETIADHAASNIEKMMFWEMLQTSALVDKATGLYNPTAFYRRLDEEFLRCVDHKVPGSLCMFQIDKYAALDPAIFQERNEKALYHVISIIRKYLKPYDIFGKADSMTFAIVLTELPVEKSKLWAERIRNEIAVTSLDIGGKHFNATVSMGLSDVSKADSIDTLVANTRKALDQSLSKTNYVSIYS